MILTVKEIISVDFDTTPLRPQLFRPTYFYDL